MLEKSKMRPFLIALLLVISGVAASIRAGAATLCVDPAGTHGCFSTISAAVSHASAGDTINVAAGTYKENVVIGIGLSLVGADPDNTIIDATGLPNGIYIDGLDNAGLSHVAVSRLTVKNANFEGILVTNASDVSILRTNVIKNDNSLNFATAECPGLPAFQTAEGEDCGEGIHLIAVDHSLVANNTVTNNSGGILITDETGSTHDNLITGNVVTDNVFDCGITLASHPPAASTHASAPFGIFHNTISGNEISGNGVNGIGSGVGIFTFLPGGTVSGNVVIHNAITDNGLPGIAFHAHGPNENLNDNMLIGNRISRNGADSEDAATPGPTGINIYGVSPITGIVISENVIEKETDDIVVNTPARVAIHLNELLGREIGVDNLGTGTADATQNWWGCSAGPASRACSNVGGAGVLFDPWLTMRPKPDRKTD